MPKENQTDPRSSFPTLVLPWLLGAAMLIVYCLTLNHWVTLSNISQVAQISGWLWQPQLISPLFFLVTLPFHWLPASMVPFALNLFSAVCAALTLGLLARSVAILPQDRTEVQRQREKSDFSFLTGWQAFFPPILAVLLLGMQLTFWKHATSCTGAMFDLLLFAFIVWLLLEYRLDEREWRLMLASVVYGVGIAENWAFVGFFPIFLTAIIWLKRLDFFNVRFMTRMLLCGLAGMLLFLLLPLTAQFSGNYQISIWEALRPNIRMDWQVIKAVTNSDVRYSFALASLSTLLPVLVMAIRWRAGFGDKSLIGVALIRNLFHLVYAVIFGVCVWVMFNPPFSPQELLRTPALTLYYLTALCIGYFCGYFLLVFGRKVAPSRRYPRPKQILPKGLRWLCPIIVGGTFAVGALAVGMMIYRSLPFIREVNDNMLLKFAHLSIQNLPKKGAILLCDSDNPTQNQSLRSILIQAMLAREGRTQAFPVVDTSSLNWVPYHRFLHKRHPKQLPLIVKPDETNSVNPLRIFAMLHSLSQSNALYYLNPSYGYYFEQFYQEPHGLVYLMKSFPTNALLPPPLSQKLITENETFWSNAMETLSPAIQRAMAPSDTTGLLHLGNWLLMHLHATEETNQNAVWVGMLCSRGLDDWGVALQRAGDLKQAATRFKQAIQFYPDNVVAGINLAFNQKLRSGKTNFVLKPVSTDQFGKYRNWNAVLNANGPFDEVSFCFENGLNLTRDGMFRQAAQQFSRVFQLMPGNLAVRYELAQVYLFARQPDRTLEILHGPLTQPGKFGLNPTNSTGLNLLASAAYFQKNKITEGSRLLETEMYHHPDDNTLLTVAAQAYMLRGLYTNALSVMHRKLARTPDDVKWLLGEGIANIQIGHYDQAITALTQALKLQTNNPAARFNRALAYLQSGRLDKARADYSQLQFVYTNSFQIAYGLGEIAWKQHDTNEAIRNYQIYIANAPTNAPEFQSVREHLAELKATGNK